MSLIVISLTSFEDGQTFKSVEDFILYVNKRLQSRNNYYKDNNLRFAQAICHPKLR